MNKHQCPRCIQLSKQLRKLWEQHVYWTRFFIISTAADLGDLKPVTNRLLRNPMDFAQLLAPFYGDSIAEEFEMLFTQHLLIAADLVNAAKNQDKDKADQSRRAWYQNADEIAVFLSEINPYWSNDVWRDLLHSHLEMTEMEAVLRLSGKYEKDIKIFDEIEEEALKMADYMTYGISRQFCLR